MPIPKNKKLGNHTLINGDITPLTEKVVETVENNTYKALNATPTPRFLPIPPRTFFELNVTPNSVMINAPIGLAHRFHHSVSNACTLPAPRLRCLSIYSFNSGLVIICAFSAV